MSNIAARGPASPSITAASYGVMPLSQSLPAIFTELVNDYAEVLDLALEQRAFRVETAYPERVKRLAERVGFLQGGPRDAIDVHVAALRQKSSSGVPAERVRAYRDEGRLTIL